MALYERLTSGRLQQLLKARNGSRELLFVSKSTFVDDINQTCYAPSGNWDCLSLFFFAPSIYQMGSISIQDQPSEIISML